MLAGPDPAGALGEWRSDEPVCVAVPDATRPLGLHAPLAALRERLPNLEVVVGLGLHRPMSSAELEALAPWRPRQHDPDDCVETEVVDGIPGAVGRALAEAPWSLSLGIAELHQYAGVSGGHKGVAVGCGGRATISALHARERVLAPGVVLGAVEGNPFRAAVDGLGEAAGCRLALVKLAGQELWLAGEPRAVVAEAARRLQPFWTVPQAASGAVLRVPPAKAASFYQASRAASYLALSPRPPVQEGGLLVVDASCPEGLGAEAGFRAALASCAPPWTELLTGPPPTGAGAQRAVILAAVARRFRLRVHGCARPEALEAVGIEATSAPAPCGQRWLDVTRPFERLPQLASEAS